MNFSDLYGGSGPGMSPGEAEPQTTQAISGTYNPGPAQAPAISWVAFVALLVGLRVLWEIGG